MQDVASRLSRRALVKTGIVGVLAVGLGSIGLSFQDSAVRPDTPELKVLDATEFAILAALAARLCPAEGAGAPGADKLALAKLTDERLLTLDEETQKGVKIALRAFENATFGALVGERLRPFTKLSEAQQDAIIERWRSSRIGFRRTVYKALSSLVASLYWGQPETWARIGYTLPNPANLRAAYADNLVDLDSLRATHHAAREN